MRELATSTFHLSVVDIANADGICRATTRAGVTFDGFVDRALTNYDVLHLKAAEKVIGSSWRRTGGWHTIDWEEVAAISGEVA